MATPVPAPDAELARAAQGGDSGALGLLLERHRAGLHAHALTMVGFAHAQDAVQDTFLLVLRKIDQLRDPDAVVGWLHSALRSVCLTRLRREQGELPLDEASSPAAPAHEEPEANIERLALRDWTWTAIGALSEPLRVVAMLRYFGSYNSYEEIASICDVPVGTVRSRLSQVKLKLADRMLATAQAAHGESSARARLRERDMTDAVNRLSRAHDISRYVEPMTDDVEGVFAGGVRFTGRLILEASLHGDLADGVGMEPTQVIAGRGITILEARFINPPDDPHHCPPALAQIHYHHSDDTTYRVALHYAAREPVEPDASAQNPIRS